MSWQASVPPDPIFAPVKPVARGGLTPGPTKGVHPSSASLVHPASVQRVTGSIQPVVCSLLLHASLLLSS